MGGWGVATGRFLLWPLRAHFIEHKNHLTFCCESRRVAFVGSTKLQSAFVLHTRIPCKIKKKKNKTSRTSVRVECMQRYAITAFYRVSASQTCHTFSCCRGCCIVSRNLINSVYLRHAMLTTYYNAPYNVSTRLSF